MKAYFYLMRFHRPLPILIILYPTLWGLFSVTHGLPPLKLIVIFILGAITMRTAGCVFNDIADRNFDGAVERTAMRPIATGLISVKRASFLGLFLLIFAFVLVLQLNFLTILLSFVAVALALTYPLFKRFFALPQLALGFAFNFGIIMTYMAVQNSIPPTAWLLYFASIFWTIAYDTMYAFADKTYDLALNLKSSAITFGKHNLMAVILAQLLMLICLSLFSYFNDFNILFYLALVIVMILFFYQHQTWHKGGIHNCIKAFSDNHWVGMIIFIAILIQ